MKIPTCYNLAIDSLNARGHDHSDGMQRDLSRDLAHTVSHFESSVEQHAVFHGKGRCLDTPIHNGRCPELHAFFRRDISGDLSFGYNGSGGNFGLDHGLFTNQEHPVGMNFSVEVSINSHGASIGDGALEFDALSHKGADVPSPLGYC